MKINRLIYTSDPQGQSFKSFDMVKKMSCLKEFGLKEALFPQKEPYELWKDGLSLAGIKPRKIPGQKRAGVDVMKSARHYDASLIVANHEGRRKGAPSVSLIKKLINSPQHIPVLFVKNNDEAPLKRAEGLFSHVIFATDWGASSKKAFEALMELKKMMKQLDIINVIDRKLTIKDIRDIKNRLAETRRTCLGERIDAEAHIYAGKFYEEILAAANDYKGTIILMGGRTRRTPFQDMFVKNDLQKVVEESTLPVFVI